MFGQNRGIETGLHQAITEIEKGVLNGNFTLEVFVDVSSTFDKLSFKGAREAMKAKGWYQQYLENRISTIKLKGSIKEYEIRSGTPQGDILCVILWNIGFDWLLKKLGKKIKVFVFTEDGSLII